MRTLPLLLTALLCAGCATYVTPGGAVPLDALNPASVGAGSLRQPAPQFPASLAVARVQAAGYRSASIEGFGSGRFSVVLKPETLTAEQLRQVSGWKSIDHAAALDAGWLPAKLESIDDLRAAAAKMQADVLMVYTVETTFSVHEQALPPASAVKLGAKESGPAAVAVQARAVFIDVRTGFVYGQTETRSGADVSALLATAEALDRKRLEVEATALAQLLKEADKTWTGIVQQYL